MTTLVLHTRLLKSNGNVISVTEWYKPSRRKYKIVGRHISKIYQYLGWPDQHLR